MSDRAFTVAFAISLGLHLVLLIGQLASLTWLSSPRHQRPLEVIYESVMAEQELRHLQAQLSRATRDTAFSPAPANPAERAQIRIPDRPSLTADHDLADIMPERSAVVDLTNLVDASRGNPVLLSYFSAIREQIQQTANRRAWTSETVEGLVYVSFVLSSTGVVERVAIVSDRSVPSSTLQDVALRIVNGASPFPPFPPSMAESSKTILVPLEFLMGAEGGGD